MTSTGLTTYPEIYMPCPFAGEADAGGTSGTNRAKDFSDSKSAASVNMRTGFPSVFTLARSSNGKYLSRSDMNQLGYMATVGQYRKQIGCLNEFNSSFASKIGGYAKGAVLDYVVWHDNTNHLVSEVWKIVSLKDKNSTAPTTANILSFGTAKETAGGSDKLWMRIVPDKEYIENVKSACKDYTDAETSRAKGVEASKIDTSTANLRFANGTNQKGGCTDGTACDDKGKELTTHSTSLVKSGHVHTNVYTKTEIDAMISAQGGSFASGASQVEGFHVGTYSMGKDASGATWEKGHTHADLARGSNSKDGIVDCTAKNGTNIVVEPTFSNNIGTYKDVVTGHYHTNYATAKYVADQFSDHIKNYPHSSGGGSSATYEGNSDSFSITIGSILIQGGTFNVATSLKDYHRGSVSFNKSFRSEPVVVAQISPTAQYKNLDGVSNVYVDTVTTRSFNYVYDNAGKKRTCTAYFIAIGCVQ